MVCLKSEIHCSKWSICRLNLWMRLWNNATITDSFAQRHHYTLLFPKFLIRFCSDGLCECAGQVWSLAYSFIRSLDGGNSDWSLGWGCKPGPPFLGKRRLYGVVDGTRAIERAFVSSYWPAFYSNFSSVFSRFRDLPLCAPAHHFVHPTSSLPQISPCFSGNSWMVFVLAYEERKCWANCPCN